MPGARWFPGARLNFAEHLLRAASDDRPALIFAEEGADPVELAWPELRRQVAALAANLRSWGVGPGDRVAAYLPNIPQTIVAFLAAASVGAIWSSCGPDLGVPAVLDRFTEIGLIDDPAFARAWVESRHHGRGLSRRALASELQRRGVADEDVHEAIELIDDDQEAVMALQVIAGKVRGTRGQPFATRIRKLMGVLARKGYGAALAYRVVREALEAVGAHAAEIAAEIGEPDPDIGSDDCP